MTTICSICLESKINLQSIGNDNLENFYDELCDYDNGFKSKFCAVCLYKLKKCYEFKKYCHLAAKTLNTWMKQSETETMPKHLLYTRMPASQLSLCNKNNYKVYFYQTADLEGTDPIQIISSRNPHIVTVNIPRDNYIDKPDSAELENADEEDMEKLLKKEPDIKVEFVDYTDSEKNAVDILEVPTVKSENNDVPVIKKLSDEELESDDNDSGSDDFVLKKSLNEMSSDSDESSDDLEDELPPPKRAKRTSTAKAKKENNSEKKTKPNKTKRITAKELKVKLKEKIKKFGDVKDEKGNVVDMEIVLNNLDKTSLSEIQKVCSDPGPFSQLAISKLAEIQNRFAHDALFDKIRIETQEEILAEFKRRRESLNYTKKSHHCESCLKGFPSQALLDYHVKIGHNPTYQFECPICHMRMNTRKRYRTHSYTHNTVFKCKLCAFATGSRSIMIPHVNKHQGVKYPCEQCGNVYSDIRARAAHRNREHAPQHICPLCADAFTFASGLKFHHVKKHQFQGEEFVQSENNKKCEECNILFISGEIYNKHMKTTHNKIDKTGQDKPKLTRKRDANKKNIYTCRLCEWKGLGRLMQIEHYQTQHPGASLTVEGAYKYLCHDCGKQFKCVTAYTGHMNKHKGTRPYACSKCPKTFFSRLVLDSHALRHLPPSKECPHCGKKFTTPTGLRGHIRTHSTDRRFICNICGKGFLFSGALREHVTGVHHNIRRKKTRQPHMDCMDSD